MTALFIHLKFSTNLSRHSDSRDHTRMYSLSKLPLDLEISQSSQSPTTSTGSTGFFNLVLLCDQISLLTFGLSAFRPTGSEEASHLNTSRQIETSYPLPGRCGNPNTYQMMYRPPMRTTKDREKQADTTNRPGSSGQLPILIVSASSF